ARDRPRARAAERLDDLCARSPDCREREHTDDLRAGNTATRPRRGAVRAIHRNDACGLFTPSRPFSKLNGVKEFSYWSARFGPAIRFALAALVFGVARVQYLAAPAGQRLWISVLAVAGLAWTVYAARAWGTCVAIGGDGVE